MNQSTINVISEIVKDINNIILEVFKDNEIGENIKVNENTLWGSDLQKQAEVKLSNSTNVVIQMLFNDYLGYVERGREAKHTPRVPIEPLMDWAKKKAIKMDNKTIRQIAFIAQRSIYEKGIRPRPILYYVFKNMDESWDKNWSNNLFNSILSDLNNYFKD